MQVWYCGKVLTPCLVFGVTASRWETKDSHQTDSKQVGGERMRKQAAASPTVDPKPIKIRQGGTSLLFWSCPRAKSSMYIQAQADQDAQTNAIILLLPNQTGVMLHESCIVGKSFFSMHKEKIFQIFSKQKLTIGVFFWILSIFLSFVQKKAGTGFLGSRFSRLWCHVFKG